MTLLITVFAAILFSVKWYNRQNDDMRLGSLCLMLWGASLMWLVDAVYEYAELRSAYFTPAAEDMLNDSFLGLSVVAFALVIWLVRLFIFDPKGSVRAALQKERVYNEK